MLLVGSHDFVFGKLKVFCRIAVGENPMKEIEKRPGMDAEITRSFIMAILWMLIKAC